MTSSEPEMVAVYGFLDRGANFTLRRCYSTRTIRRWPRGNDSYALELLDEAGRVLVRSHPEVAPEETCTAEALTRWRVFGYVGLRDAAATLRLTGEELVLWQAKVLPPPSLQIEVGEAVQARERPVTLRLKYSPPGDNAYMQLVYQWGEKQFQVVDYYPPAETLTVDLRALPGGKRCRLVALYSNGIRSAGAATEHFAVPETGPQLSIVTPVLDTSLLPGQPLQLVGQVLDRERPGGARPDTDLSWWLDDELVGRGAIACVQQPKPGRRQIRLRYEPREVDVQTTVFINEWSEGMPLPAALWDARSQ
jgi:hypothetical protein